jgi:predicted ATPase
MLTRIYIDNFRCFVNFEYRPESKQLLLGPNGSGKSSLFTAISYLKQFVKGEDNPFTQASRTRWLDRPLQVFEIEALLDDQKYEYRLQIQFAPETKQMSVSQEQLKVSGATVFELANGEIHFFPTKSSQATSIPFETTHSALHLWQLSNSHVRRFVDWMRSVRCFRIDEHPSVRDESADREIQEPDDELGNFAGWYRYLVQSYPDENVRYITSLREALAGFQTLRFSPDEDGTRKLRADFAGPRKEKVTYALAELSEGQWCLLCLYMILHFTIVKGYTVLIDEPDNFIALREIQPWLKAAEEAVEDHDGQLILMSHHPELLNQWASSHGLRFFREDNGHVRTENFKADPHGNLQPSELIARGWDDE